MVWVLEPLWLCHEFRYLNRRGPIKHCLKVTPAEDGHARLHEEHLTKAEMMEEGSSLVCVKESRVAFLSNVLKRSWLVILPEIP